MKAVYLTGTRSIEVRDRPDPELLTPKDVIVRVVAACVCGSDLWGYRDYPGGGSGIAMGHEMVGVIEQVGAEVETLHVGDFVISPFSLSDGTCQSCRAGATSVCDHVTFFGSRDPDRLFIDGAQGERIRMPFGESSLVVVPHPVEDSLVPHLLALSDVASTGHHAAVTAGVREGDVVVVVGDGAVGLSAVLAAARRGASRIIAMSRHADRQRVARGFGATDIVEERGDAAVRAVRELLGGDLADAALECVGTAESMQQALQSVRGGGRVGFVGVPGDRVGLDAEQLFRRNITLGGGMAPARTYIPELLPAVLDGSMRPGDVFDLELPLSDAAEAYAAMDERRAIKVLLRP
ncbi:MAG: alcohol dehydrogenase catalytic domain-containing protein [Microbacteriaceae bacterium]